MMEIVFIIIFAFSVTTTIKETITQKEQAKEVPSEISQK